jgi:hypothetical protein
VARSAKKTSLLAWLRKALLLYVLLMVALGSWLARVRSTDWNDTLRVAVYPVNAESAGRPRSAVASYIDQLDVDAFAGVADFVRREGARYGMRLDEPLRVFLGAPVTAPPHRSCCGA